MLSILHTSNGLSVQGVQYKIHGGKFPLNLQQHCDFD